MKRYFAITFALIMTLSLVSCGSNDGMKLDKKWLGYYTHEMSDPYEIKNFMDEFSLDLNGDGTGIFEKGGEEYDVSWDEEDGEIRVAEKYKGRRVTYHGYIEDGKLHLFDGDESKSDTMEYVFE